MTGSRHTNGLLAVISLAVIGYMLFTLPPQGARTLRNRRQARHVARLPVSRRGRHRRARCSLGLAVGILVRRLAEHAAENRPKSNAATSAPAKCRPASGRASWAKTWPPARNMPPAKASRRSCAARSKPPSPSSKPSASRSSWRSSRSARSPAASRRCSNALAGRDVFRTERRRRHDGHAQRDPLAGGRPRRARRHARAGRSSRRIAGRRSGRRRQERRPRAVRRRRPAQGLRARPARSARRKWKSGSSSASTRKTGTTTASARSSCGQIVEQVSPMVKAADVVAVRSRPVSRRRVHVLADGREEEEAIAVEPRHRPARRPDDGDRRTRRPRPAAGQPAAAIARPGRRSQASACWPLSTSGPTR